MYVFSGWMLMLHEGAGEKLLFSPRRESSSLSENSRELSFGRSGENFHPSKKTHSGETRSDSLYPLFEFSLRRGKSSLSEGTLSPERDLLA